MSARTLSRVVPLLLAALLSASAATATTYVVRPDGTGDFPTIQAAIDAATNGDIVELTDGTFTGDGNRDIDYAGKALTVRSQSGNSESCVIDCEGTEAEPHRGFLFQSAEPEGAVLTGVTLINGWASSHPFGGGILITDDSSPSISASSFVENRGSAIVCVDAGSPTITDCAFLENANPDWRGGGIGCEASHPIISHCEFVRNSASMGGAIHAHAGTVMITECTFDHNTAEIWGGAVGMLYSCTGTVLDCRFSENSADNDGGAINLHYATATIEHSEFSQNAAPSGGAMCTGKVSHANVMSCTFWGNVSREGSAVFCGERDVYLENTIIAFNPGGWAIADAGIVTLVCSDIYGNPGGDWMGSLASQLGINGNICEDPLFCDPVGGDLSLCADSPCAAGNNPECGQIGVRAVGCGPCGSTPVDGTTWGAIKASFK
jgi:predicted outer membrane repeat protein